MCFFMCHTLQGERERVSVTVCAYRMNSYTLAKSFILAIIYMIIFLKIRSFWESSPKYSLQLSNQTTTNNQPLQSCPSPHPTALNVHIVCHTHLDTGWVETYDEYYFRCKCIRIPNMILTIIFWIQM